MTSAWFGVRDLSRTQICARLRLSDTRRPADLGQDELAVAELPNGWTIVSSLRFAYPSRKRMARLSRDAEVVVVLFQPNVMVSGAEGWRDGRLSWSVSHQYSNGPYNLDIRGEPPEALAGLYERQRREQDEAGGAEAADDYLIIVPLLLGRETCGYFPGDPPFPYFTRLDPLRRGFLDGLRDIFRA